MLTLCPLAGPVSIRPPQSAHLKPFRFFTSRTPQYDGGERLHLHMGYFRTRAEAEKWLPVVRGRFPDAFVTPAPPGPSEPLSAESLTDSQVLKLLEARGRTPGEGAAGGKKTDDVALLRPDETHTRQALKEAVARGAPVSFAVQLRWSEGSIDVSRVRSLEIFKGYSLYAIETRRAAHSHHFLRLGFFGDPMAAKELAAQVRSHFASAAVIPVADDEVMRVREAAVSGASVPYLRAPGLEEMPTGSHTTAVVPEPKPARGRSSGATREAETLEQTLERLAHGESWRDPDSLSDSGVRHLKIQVDRPDSPSRQAWHRLEGITHRMKLLWMGQH